MEVLKIDEHADGTATLSVELTSEEILMFAKVGILTALTEYANAVIEEETTKGDV